MSGIRRLGAFTPARVGLARSGVSVGTAAQLEFQLDHALARDAVYSQMNVKGILSGIAKLGLKGVALRSAVPAGTGERQTYLRRPDLGRRLSDESAAKLTRDSLLPDVVFCIADGLSALAVERHALALIATTLPALRMEWTIGPVCIVSQGRVAVGDDIGERLGARAVVMLVGERPGLSAADSLGVYITWAPRVGRTDAERNCISNVRTEGLGYAEAAARIMGILNEAKRLGVTGVALGALPGNRGLRDPTSIDETD